MTVKCKLILAVFTLSGFQVLAQPSMSEFFFQAPAGKSFATIQAGYLNREFKVVNAASGASVGTATDKGLTQAGLRYEMGLNEMWSIEGVITYSIVDLTSADSTKDKGRADGLDDVQINLKGTSNMNGFHLRYGASNRIGIFPAQFSNTSAAASAGTNFNNSSGSFTFTPYLGADVEVGHGLLGAKVSYDLLKQDRVLHGPGGTQAFGGGQDFIVTVFYEWSLEPSLLGLSLNYFNENGSTSSNTSLSGWAGYGANLYARFGYNDSWSVIPSVGYDWNATKSNVDYYTANNIDSGFDWKVNVALRYAF